MLFNGSFCDFSYDKDDCGIFDELDEGGTKFAILGRIFYWLFILELPLSIVIVLT